jgi:hypothetical protein
MLKKLLIVCGVCLALFPIHKATAQYVRVGVDGDIPLGKLDEMESMLSLADSGQKAGLLARLGVDPVIAKYVAEGLQPGETIELKPIRTPGEADYGAVFLRGGTGVTGYLYLLKGSDQDPKKNAWHVIDHQEINCWDGPYSYEIMSLRRSDGDDIVLHHVNENHGSGVVANQTQVYSILNGRLVQTLATQDYLSQLTLGTEDTLEQRSTFLRFPGNSLEETRTSTFNDKLKKVERRYWRWSEQKQKFLPGQFRLIVAPLVEAR